MNLSSYESFVKNNSGKFSDDTAYCVIAINGEAGEIAEWYKKYTLRGNPGGEFSHKDLALELGDVLWYVTKLAQVNGWSLSDIMEMNFAKISDRKINGKVVG